MSTDPYNPVTASDFTALRNYVGARNVSVASQLAGGSVGVAPTAPPATISAHPNPTNDQMRVAFHVDRPGPVLVCVYDARGARVRTLVDGQLEAGPHHVEWEGTDDRGRAMKSGVYFIACKADGRTWSRRAVLFR